MANGGTLPQVGGMGIVQSPPILGQNVDINEPARRACDNHCRVLFPIDAQGNNPPGYSPCLDTCMTQYPVKIDPGLMNMAQPGTGDAFACSQCGITNIKGCFACAKIALTETFFIIVTNAAVIILVLMGVYMLVSGNSPLVGVRNAVGAAKKAGVRAAEVAVLA